MGTLVALVYAEFVLGGFHQGFAQVLDRKVSGDVDLGCQGKLVVGVMVAITVRFSIGDCRWE
jgi:hypothetical protein